MALCSGNDGHAPAGAAAKLDGPFDQGEKGVIPSNADVRAGVKLGPTLPHQNVTGNHALASKTLHSQALSVRVTAVARRAGALFRSKELQIEVKHRRPIVAERTENATTEPTARDRLADGLKTALGDGPDRMEHQNFPVADFAATDQSNATPARALQLVHLPDLPAPLQFFCHRRIARFGRVVRSILDSPALLVHWPSTGGSRTHLTPFGPTSTLSTPVDNAVENDLNCGRLLLSRALFCWPIQALPKL